MKTISDAELVGRLAMHEIELRELLEQQIVAMSLLEARHKREGASLRAQCAERGHRPYPDRICCAICGAKV